MGEGDEHHAALLGDGDQLRPPGEEAAQLHGGSGGAAQKGGEDGLSRVLAPVDGQRPGFRGQEALLAKAEPQHRLILLHGRVGHGGGGQIAAGRAGHEGNRVGSAAGEHRAAQKQQDQPIAHQAAPFLSGSVTVKVEPLPGAESTVISPRCSCTICRTMERPRPVPPVSRERALSTR